MTNEWLEFKAYTDKPVFKVESKKSVSFLGRFTTDMISRFVGFNHIFVILARGIIFHNTDSSLKDGDPYSRIEEARRFLCAWCSIPERKYDSKAFDGKFKTDFRNLHSEFPDIVDEDGKGWYYRYMEKLSAFIKSHQNQVNKCIHFIPEHFNDWKKEWKNKVIHYQTSLYANTTQSEFPLLFDTAIADALELGPLRTEEVELTEEQIECINAFKPDGIPESVMPEIAKYYIANKRPESDWVILPVTNMSAYFHSTEFSKKWLPKIPEEFLERKKTSFGVCAIRINLHI